MERLHVLLIDVLGRHKAHGRTRHRFRDRFGIAAVVFIRFDVRLDELRCHELHLVAIRTEASRPVMRAATGFYADAYRGQLREKGYQVMSGHALAIHDVAPVIHSHRVKYVLGDIDPEDVHLVLHGTRLLWLYGFTALELIVAHCSRSAQGRVHFITTFSQQTPSTSTGCYTSDQKTVPSTLRISTCNALGCGTIVADISGFRQRRRCVCCP